MKWSCNLREKTKKFFANKKVLSPKKTLFSLNFLKETAMAVFRRQHSSCNSDNKKKAGNPLIQGFQLSFYIIF